MICCDGCPKVYHLECTEPPLKRVPRGKWLCHHCGRSRNNRATTRNGNFSLTLDHTISALFLKGKYYSEDSLDRIDKFIDIILKIQQA